jgi:hemerythrin superfamily protein
LGPGRGAPARVLPSITARALRRDHQLLEQSLDRLRTVADALDDADPPRAVELIVEASRIVAQTVVEHERDDEKSVYPRLSEVLGERHALSAMSRAHREILHLSRLLALLAEGLRPEDADKYLVRDAQRVIESIEALVRIHNAQEEDIYDHAVAI